METGTQVSASSTTDRTHQLLVSARDGNDLAFEELIRLFRADIYRVALGIMRNPEEASDICQDVFIRFYKNLGRLRKERGLKAWLRRVTINRCFDILRTRKRDINIEDVMTPGCMQMADSSNAPEVSRMIQQGLDILPPRERAALILTAQLGYSSIEAAKAMGCSPATVRVLAFKARDKVKALLNPSQNAWRM